MSIPTCCFASVFRYFGRWRLASVWMQFFCLSVAMSALAQGAAPEKKPLAIPESSYNWWRQARFGIFIHWNTSSVLQLGEGSWFRKNPTDEGIDYHKAGVNKMSKTLPSAIADGSYQKYKGRGGVPMEIYDNLYHVFNPKDFNADEWAKSFKEAGAGYIVFTTKHHDGFCMFDSKYTDYDIMNTPFGRDIAKELSDACRKQGLKVIWYYSKADWFDPRHNVNNPAPYAEYLTNQVTELLTNYGEISGIWWDGGEIVVPTRPLFDTILNLQPHTISNGRIQKNNEHVPGVTFGTPEQELGAFNMKSPWESCVTMMGEHWFWNGGQDIRTSESCLRLLINCAIGDGNLLLDFGPDELGRIHPAVQRNFANMGQWLKAHGQSIYGTRGGPYIPSHWGGSTRRGNTVYLHITQKWPGGKLQLPPLPRKVVSARAITGGAAKLEQSKRGISLQLAAAQHDPVSTVVALELDGSAMDIAPIPSAHDHWKSLTVNAEVTASSHAASWIKMQPASVVLHSWEKGAPKTLHFSEETVPAAGDSKAVEVPKGLEELAKTTRGHVWRFWRPKNDDTQPWLMVNLGKARTFDQIYLREKFNRIRAFEIQIEKNNEWQTIFAGTELDVLSLSLPEPVTAQKVRLLITKWSKETSELHGPSLQEFDLFLTAKP